MTIALYCFVVTLARDVANTEDRSLGGVGPGLERF